MDIKPGDTVVFITKSRFSKMSGSAENAKHVLDEHFGKKYIVQNIDNCDSRSDNCKDCPGFIDLGLGHENYQKCFGYEDGFVLRKTKKIKKASTPYNSFNIGDFL